MIPVRSASLVPAILERSSAAIAGRSLMVHTAPHAQERETTLIFYGLPGDVFSSRTYVVHLFT